MRSMLTVFKALADRNRLRIVAALQVHPEFCACQITELLQVSGATVSRHMAILMQAGLVESRKEGRWTYFRLVSPPGGAVLCLQNWLREEADKSSEIDRDRQRINTILSQDKEVLCRRQRGADCCPTSTEVHPEPNVEIEESQL